MFHYFSVEAKKSIGALLEIAEGDHLVAHHVLSLLDSIESDFFKQLATEAKESLEYLKVMATALALPPDKREIKKTEAKNRGELHRHRFYDEMRIHEVFPSHLTIPFFKLIEEHFDFTVIEHLQWWGEHRLSDTFDENINYDNPEHQMSVYFKQVTVVDLLSFEEEITLARRMDEGRKAQTLLSQYHYDDEDPECQRLKNLVQGGIEARDYLIRGNTRLVIEVAKRYMHRYELPFSDLIQLGNIGLVKAVDRYEFDRGNRFSTYAVWWIRQSIIRGARNMERLIRVPINQYEVRNAILKVIRTMLEEKNGEYPTMEEVALRMGKSVEYIEDVMATFNPIDSLDQEAETTGESGLALMELIQEEKNNQPEHILEKKEVIEIIKRALEGQEERVWVAVALYTELDLGVDARFYRRLSEMREERARKESEDVLSSEPAMWEVGKIMDVPMSRERARQLYIIGINAIKKQFELIDFNPTEYIRELED